MRIGLVIDYFKPHAVGGAERSTAELARALTSRGHQVTILTPNYGAPSEETDKGVQIHRYWFPRRIEPGRLAPAFWIKNPIYYWISGRAIARIARRLRIELLHAQNTFVQVPTYLASRRAGVPAVATVRDLGSLCASGHLAAVGYDPDHICSESFRRCAREFIARYYPHAPLGFRLRLAADSFFKQTDLRRRQRLLRRYAKIIFVSHGLKEEYVRHGFPVAADRLEVAYNLPPEPAPLADARGSLPAAWRLPERAPVLAYVGKLSLGKGADVLLKAIPGVVERHPDAVFVFAGSRTPQVEIPSTIPERNIRLLGRIPNDQVHALLGRASLLVLPSVWPEPLSSAVLEALAFSVPVIGTKRGGTPEQVVDGRNGFLVEPGDAQALARAITAALDNPEALRRMREGCATILRERFDPDKIIATVTAIYQGAARLR